MIDETTGQNWEATPGTGTAEPQGASTGYCQDCGKPLTPDTIRTVGNAVFCEPCLQTRLNPGAMPPPPQPGQGSPSQGYGTAMPPVASSLPSPTAAGWIGTIPGAGAMYNGQYAKGFAHLLIFVVLANLKDHVSESLGILCFGWWVYMIFDAVYTARARRDGLPLPNPFHLNDIGERLAYGKWSQHPVQPGQATPPPPTNPAGANWQAVPPVNPAAQANWAGYVPPTAFGVPATPMPSPYVSAVNDAQAAVDQAQAHVNDVRGYAYTQTGFGQAGYVAPAVSQPAHSNPVDPSTAWNAHTAAVPFPAEPTASKRFPVAAVVLIGAGLLFLLANVFPSFHVNGSVVTAVVLGILAIVLFLRRLKFAEQMEATTGESSALVMLRLQRWPIMLAVLSILFALQALEVAWLGQTWAVILIVWGGFALLDRATPVAQPGWTPVPPVPPVTPQGVEVAKTETEEAR